MHANNPIKYTDPDGRWISEFDADPSEAMYELMAEDGGDPCPDCKVIPLDEVVITAERVKKETQQREVVITAERIKDDYEIPRLPENDPPTSSFAGLPIVGAVAPEVLAVGAVIWLAYYYYTNPGAITLPIHNPEPWTFAKESKKTGKERATDMPDWVRGRKPNAGESGKDFAKRLLDAKYGPGNYPLGPGSEFNKIKKGGDRGK